MKKFKACPNGSSIALIAELSNATTTWDKFCHQKAETKNRKKKKEGFCEKERFLLEEKSVSTLKNQYFFVFDLYVIKRKAFFNAV